MLPEVKCFKCRKTIPLKECSSHVSGSSYHIIKRKGAYKEICLDCFEKHKSYF